MFLTSEMNPARFRGLWSILKRNALPQAGSNEDRFFTGAVNFKNHKTGRFGLIVGEVLKNPTVEWLLVSRNQNLILDESLSDRIASTLAHLEEKADHLTLISGGGLGKDNERYCAFYSSLEPFVFFNPGLHPIVDTMLDLYLVSARDARSFISENGLDIDEAFELAIINYGYRRKNKVSLFTPHLAAGINGHFVGRNILAVTEQIERLPSPVALSQTLPSLAGPIKISRHPESDELGRKAPSKLQPLDQAVENALSNFVDGPTVSIVTRTQFKRTFLLRRLLTSISRARVDTLPIEVILSSDITEQEAVSHLNLLRSDFPHLNLKLCVNRRREHSRVANLIGGAEAARGDYIWFMDDDDYVDLFAFRTIQSAFFLGARPFLIGDCVVHKEEWDTRNMAFPVLVKTNIDNNYPGANWRSLFNGVNHLPICGPVIPRKFLLDRVSQFNFIYDLSEDYTLFLLLLSSEELPPVVNLSRVISHISVRENSDNTVTAEDRTGWTRDILNYIYDLLYDEKSRAKACWSTLFGQPRHAHSFGLPEQMQSDQAALKRKNSEFRHLERENEYLRMLIKREWSHNFSDRGETQ